MNGRVSARARPFLILTPSRFSGGSSYKQELTAHWPTNNCLGVIAPDKADIFENPACDAGLSWQLVADMAAKVGRARGGKLWATRALGVDADLRQRTLADFVHYLETEGLAVNNEPINSLDVAISARAAQTLERVDRLIEQAVDEMGSFISGGRQPRTRTASVEIFRLLVATDQDQTTTFAGDESGYRALSFNPLDNDDEPGEPTISAAVWFDKPSQPVLDALSDPTWRAAAESRGLIVDPADQYASIGARRNLSQLIRPDATFADQAADLGAWATAAITQIEAMLLLRVPIQENEQYIS